MITGSNNKSGITLKIQPCPMKAGWKQKHVLITCIIKYQLNHSVLFLQFICMTLLNSYTDMIAVTHAETTISFMSHHSIKY